MQHEIFGRNWPVGSAPGVTVVKKKKNARCALMVKGTYFSKNNGGLI